ncbi:MAG: glucose-6-phosphate dehydrogenase assembly protein OpcA [Chlamydiales bacterium]|jgi:glucose-6-phosphate dehydrogenase assembly protein OpcA
MITKADVFLANIEEELQEIWNSFDEDNRARACLYTLIIYAPYSERLDYYQYLVDTLMHQYPCRIIFVTGNSTIGQEYLRTSVSAESVEKLGHSITCELISIEAAGKHLERVPFIILPHIIPDIPVYLAWGKEPCEDRSTFQQLQKFSTRIIYDSDASHDLSGFTRTLLSRLSPSNNTSTDLNWARLSEWRHILAKTFDTKERREHLSKSQNIHISYSDLIDPLIPQPSLRSRYLQCWLAAKLGWSFLDSFTSEGKQNFLYQHKYGTLTISISPESREEYCSGAITSIEISTHDKQKYSLKRQGLHRLIRIQTSTPERCNFPITLPLSYLNKEQSLIQETFYAPLNSDYFETLQVLAKQQEEYAKQN